MYEFAIEVAAAHGDGQDYARVLETHGGIVIALADGAGGTGNGAVAARAVVDAAVAPTVSDWCALLEDLDPSCNCRGG